MSLLKKTIEVVSPLGAQANTSLATIDEYPPTPLTQVVSWGIRKAKRLPRRSCWGAELLAELAQSGGEKKPLGI